MPQKEPEPLPDPSETETGDFSDETFAEETALSLEAFNAFSCRMASTVLSSSTRNAAVSPLSCGFALGMLLAGAGGKTAAELGAVFSPAAGNPKSANETLRQTSRLLTGLDKQVTLTTANSLWHNQDFRVRRDYREAMEKYYDARVQALDFSDRASVGIINDWVERQTNNRISRLIDAIKPDQAAFIVNALYFKGAWTTAFDKAKTRPMDFYPDGGAPVLVPMMHSADLTYAYAETERGEVITLGYGEAENPKGGLLFTVMLPPKDLGTEELSRNLDYAEFQGLLEAQDSVGYELFLPKFVLESELILNDHLTALGLGGIFARDADFSPMLETDGSLSLDYIKQKCWVSVSEEGTEAAAATAAAIKSTSLPKKKKVVIVDRPFLFLIHERKTGIILFAGVVKTPEQSS